MTENQLKCIEPILNTFENEDIKTFAIEVMNNLPSYIWNVGASSTAKYHPSYTVGQYGLIKHSIAVVRFINFFFELEQYNKVFDSRQRDLLRLAALTHDGRKSGSQEDYENNKHTKFNHPLLMAKEYMSYKDKGFLPENELKFIASSIGKHMGQWNTDKRSDTVLPKPNDQASELLHLADYLASRKCLNMSFDEYDFPIELPDLSEYRISFGKHSGQLLTEIPKDYLKWLIGTDLKEPLKSLVIKVLKESNNE